MQPTSDRARHSMHAEKGVTIANQTEQRFRPQYRPINGNW